MINLGGPVTGADIRPITRASRAASLSNALVIRVLDAVCAVTLLVVLAPLILVLGLAIKVESRGPVFYRSRRVGLRGREFEMLKFRKMPDGAGGSLLTAPEDERFTRLGQLLARTKLDELPQLWNVIKGQMSLVGPRPEDPEFVRRFRTELEPVLGVKPGITGLSQLAFVREPEILDPNDREGHYMERILPQKIGLDSLYAARRSVRANLRILLWTALALFLRKDVAVHRGTGRLGVRRRPRPGLESLPVEQPAPELELGPVPAVEQSAS